jgi:hypothetical protein
MLNALNSVLDVPPLIVDRSIASTGSPEFGQTGFEDPTSVALERRLDPKPALSSVVCGGWSTILGFQDNAFAILGLDLKGSPVRRLEIGSVDPTPVSRVAMGDNFSLLLRPDGRVTAIGDLPGFEALEKATKLFAKFTIAASSHPDRTITVIFAETKTTIAPAIPGGEVAHAIEPLGPDGVVVLAASAKLYCFPKMATDPQTTIANVVSVASTRRRTIFLQADGRICELRDGKTLYIAGIPETPIKVYAGGAHFGCVSFEGSAYAWGTGTQGQLGTGSFMNSDEPRVVHVPTGKKILDAAAGEEHTVFTIVAANKFAQLLPRAMMQEQVPAGTAALSATAYAWTPQEFDIKF